MYYVGNIPAIESDIKHHGIKGQQWGVRNGPPYPLSKEKSAAVKEKGRDETPKGNAGLVNKIKEAREKRRVKKVEQLKKYISDPETQKRMRKNGEEARRAYRTQMLFEQDEWETTGIMHNYKRNRDRNCIKDPETGVYKKNREYSQDEDTKSVNPAYKTYSQSARNNCMCCTTAYELRRRGYEVIANRAAAGYEHDRLKEWFKDPKIEYEDPKTAKESIIKQGDGARGNIMISMWFGGHSMVYEVENGQLVVRDCQSGKIYRGKKNDRFFEMSKIVAYARTDNLEINWDAVKEAIV